MTSPENDSTAGAFRVGTWLRRKYHLDRVIGVGGMAVVYAATHRNKKRFAVKVLHPELSRRLDTRMRFLREGYVANTVEHSGAVTVLDDDVAEDGAAFLVMELLEGKTVELLCAEEGGKLSVGVVLCIAHQLLDTLAAAHAKTVVHRDIKPANIFITRRGEVKVLDFGIARLRETDGSSSTQTGVSMGTPAFMGPEQAMGLSSQVDAQTDIWSVGATMFALLSGESVHVGETGQHMVVLAATVPARLLVSAQPDVPAAIASVVDRALKFDKKDRWASAAAMRDEIGEVFAALFGEGISPRRLAAIGSSMVVATNPNHAISSSEEMGAPTLATPSGQRVAPAAETPAFAAQPHQGRIGGTTGQPVSSYPKPIPKSNRLQLAIGIAIAVAALTLAAILLHARAPLSSTVTASSALGSALPTNVEVPLATSEALAVPAPKPPSSTAASLPVPTASPHAAATAKPPPAPRKPVSSPRGPSSPSASSAGTTDFDRQ